MSRLNEIKNIYFIGIGGIGMSALARYFHAKGTRVSGYDRTRTPLTRELENSGIAIHYEENPELAPRDADVIVYTPAIPAQHAELVYYKENGYTVVKRSDILQWITEGSFNICVGGTHGKTTVTTMIAHILRHSGYGCNAFLGGISANYNTNFWSHERNVVVVEADEYDRSFLKLVPDIAVITAMDPDHLDIYGTPEEVENAFIQFSHKVKPGGALVVKSGLGREADLNNNNRITYSYDHAGADVRAVDVMVRNGSYHFNVKAADWEIGDVQLHMGGLHNIENVIAAITVARQLGITDDAIRSAVDAFKGVRRRFEYALNNGQHTLIDDYAHHPEELRALISGVKSIFSDRKMTLVFQPHLFSRTKDLADEFAASLDMADEVILLPIYPARELPVEGVTSSLVLNKMKLEHKHVFTKEQMLQYVTDKKPALVVMAGAGDIDAWIQPVKETLERSGG
ncbi:UDP-N-acetylmuramate--L-alanine ligase [Sediminibacterium ginsengisoli]|uniref:UDP-N-acetylmuramate--L-alanine ligase n=1 Tax=Sediminibacterium ginsengisoli TaxID=413434 RepID=A0A1T4N1M9_9BACT|nr:UDP-N-acetylmuramate--L-alanine ligase [Sediminibacterium ginsengisoli]SJZ72937.1 UDP-N-acetylmuramate--L-alanine ligase [Sediminibacterium ginsengisoli]